MKAISVRTLTVCGQTVDDLSDSGFRAFGIGIPNYIWLEKRLTGEEYRHGTQYIVYYWGVGIVNKLAEQTFNTRSRELRGDVMYKEHLQLEAL